MKRITAVTICLIFAVGALAWADVDIYIRGDGGGDITIEERFNTPYGAIYEYFEAEGAFHFFKNVTTWEYDDVTGFDEFKYINAEGEFYFEEGVWTWDPVLDHYELGAFVGFGGEGIIEFEKFVEIAYDYWVLDSWLEQDVFVYGYFDWGYVYVDHVASAFGHTAEQMYELHMQADSGNENIFQTATVNWYDSPPHVYFGVGMDFYSESFSIASFISDYGW